MSYRLPFWCPYWVIACDFCTRMLCRCRSLLRYVNHTLFYTYVFSGIILIVDLLCLRKFWWEYKTEILGGIFEFHICLNEVSGLTVLLLISIALGGFSVAIICYKDLRDYLSIPIDGKCFKNVIGTLSGPQLLLVFC